MSEIKIGIYKIINPKGKIYIGQSVNLKRRKHHYDKIQLKSQPKITNSLKKYGPENHIFEIIEECSIEQLNERETFWKIYYLEQVNNDWHMVLFCNLYDRGGGPLSEQTKLKISRGNLGRKVSEETKQLISQSNMGRTITEEAKMKISIGRTGKINTEESKERMRQSALGRHNTTIQKDKLSVSLLEFYSINPGSFKGKKHSEETMLKIQKPVCAYKNGLLIEEYPSLKKAGLANNVDSGNIIKAMQRNGKCRGFEWKYKN